MIVFRVCKARYDPWDPGGAAVHGGRWHSAGRGVIYASDSYAGAILEILAHSLRPRTLPGAHHAMRIEIPDQLVEFLDESRLPGWLARESADARGFGDQWLDSARSVALVVPSLPARPVGRTVVINPAHPDAALLMRGAPFAGPWDERLLT